MTRRGRGAHVADGAYGSKMDGSTTWGPVSVLWADASSAPESLARDVAALGSGQLARHGALDAAAARRFALGRALIADVIEKTAGPGVDVEVSTVCERCGGAHGRVRHVSGRVALSVSYAGDLVVVAGADAAAGDIGVDIERDDRDARRRVGELGRMFAPGAAPSLAEWTRIEAVLKADGRALRVDPAEVTLSPRRSVARVPGRPEPVSVATLSGPAGYVLSVAVARRAEAAR